MRLQDRTCSPAVELADPGVVLALRGNCGSPAHCIVRRLERREYRWLMAVAQLCEEAR